MQTARYATSDDMSAIARICRDSIDSFDSRVSAALEAQDTQRKPLYLSDYKLHSEISQKINLYCGEHGLDPMEIIPEDIIYSR